jgi:DNA-binding transcriptional MerR regulator
MAARRGQGGPHRPEPDRGKYRIGTVASLTGLTTHTIRAWESRYGVVRPERSEAGLRLYREDDVTRLQLLHALTEAGEPIGSLVELSNDVLRERLARHAAPAALAPEPGAEPAPLRVALLAPLLAAQLEMRPVDAGGHRVVASAERLDGLLAALRGEQIDLVIANLELLGEEPEEGLRRGLEAAPGASAVVLYAFARHHTLARLTRLGAKLIQLPVGADVLWRTVEAWQAIRRAGRERPAPPPPPPEVRGDVPPRRFSDVQIARLREVPSAVECECPNHLSALIAGLVAFESYSRQCEVESPSDAQLHRTLAEGTGRARALMEQLLEHLCAVDGIRL